LRADLSIERRPEVSKYVDDTYPEFIELRRADIEQLLGDLRELRNELARYRST
jgi:hypothetical protein